jgi:hypothetical protein
MTHCDLFSFYTNMSDPRLHPMMAKKKVKKAQEQPADPNSGSLTESFGVAHHTPWCVSGFYCVIIQPLIAHIARKLQLVRGHSLLLTPINSLWTWRRNAIWPVFANPYFKTQLLTIMALAQCNCARTKSHLMLALKRGNNTKPFLLNQNVQILVLRN